LRTDDDDRDDEISPSRATVVWQRAENTVDLWLLLSIPVAVLMTIAAGSGLFVRGPHRDAPFFALQAVAQDFITLFVVVPTLALSVWLTARGSSRAGRSWAHSLNDPSTHSVTGLAIAYDLSLRHPSILGGRTLSRSGGVSEEEGTSAAESFLPRRRKMADKISISPHLFSTR